VKGNNTKPSYTGSMEAKVPATLGDPRIIVASNRGPVSFGRDADGALVARRGAGGLVTALTGAIQARDGLWVASAMSDEDRAWAARGRRHIEVDETRFDLRYLDIEPDVYDGYYNGISNRVLWFANHQLWDVARAPVFGEETERAWRQYVLVNRAYADALDEEGARLGDAVFLVQDYHLALVPALIRERTPGARVAFFSHIPCPGPAYLGILPGPVREAYLGGMLGADVVGFQAPPWADNFLQACRALLGADVDLDTGAVRWHGREVKVRVYPISVDAERLRAAAREPDVAAAGRRLDRWRRGRALVVRADRAELSKNIVRGFLAFERFLERRPDMRGAVVFLALLTPSRQGVPEYAAYLREVRRQFHRINRRFARKGWRPIRADVRDDYGETLAAYGRYDVLMVNPVFDGMNLVAKEGPVLNERDGVLILSENAGAHWELGEDALTVNPFDIDGTASALEIALDMAEEERALRAKGLREAVERHPIDEWVTAQLRDLASRPGPGATAPARPVVRPRRPRPPGATSASPRFGRPP
jgi:trehalose 6-phosphate synthase